MKRYLRTFYVLTITQVLSIIGSAMTNVAIGIRVFNDTNDSTPLMLASFFSALPLMISGSFAGVFTDRWNRRLILIATDIGQAIGTGLLMLIAGVLMFISTALIYLWPKTRSIETDLPDYEVKTEIGHGTGDGV